ncbi:ABC transporter ATP-binding protein [Novosphingobium aquiterrae]|uniref:ABC transporter ATP-binding protein n=1 Tax=Novosphingobium aquiterrae TaxID=624388 RepID=A0ABV6PJA5_9SPHN
MLQSLNRLIGPAHRTGAAWLLVLMVASALTESLGVMLLVPLLASLGAADGGLLGSRLAAWGVGLTLGPALAAFVLLVLLRAVINQARNAAGLRLELAVINALRQRAWRALLNADWRSLAQMRRSDSASVLISHIDRSGFGINQAAAGLAALITLAGLGIAGLAIAPFVTIGGGLGGLLVLWAYAGTRRRAAQLGEAMGRAYRTIHAGLGETLDALRTVKSLQGEARAEAGAFAGFADLTRTRIAYQRDLGRGQIALQGGGAAVLAVLVWLAVARWGLNGVQILPVVALFARALPLVGSLQEAWQNYAHSRPAIDAAYALIDLAEAAREAELPKTPPPYLRQAIALDAVTVRYAQADAPALDTASFSITAGSLVAVTGASGAGKSTLADVLGGLINPDTGDLIIDGIPLDPAQRRAWRSQVAYVQQDPAVLSDTVRANLLWAAPDADMARIEAALRDAACQFVLDWPGGIDTRIGDGERTLSGGERQRLMLARALLRRPGLLILDEATSALDSHNEALIAKALTGLKGRMTVVMICHRGALLALADQTISLDRGRIVDDSGSAGRTE